MNNTTCSFVNLQIFVIILFCWNVNGNCVPITRIKNGKVNCTNYNLANSVCTYSCDSHHSLVGSATTICSFSAWDKSTPACNYSSCPLISYISNGVISCTKENQFGSQCNIKCSPGYSIFGTSVLRCIANNQWNDYKPSCHTGGGNFICQPELSFVYKSSVVCSDENRYLSTCTINCRDAGKTMSYKCADLDEQQKGIWIKQSTACSGSELSLDEIACDLTYTDVVFILDESVTGNDYTSMKTIILSLIDKLRGIIYGGNMWLSLVLSGRDCNLARTNNSVVKNASHTEEASNYRMKLELGYQNVSKVEDEIKNASSQPGLCTQFDDNLKKSFDQFQQRGRRLAQSVIVMFVLDIVDSFDEKQAKAMTQKGIKLMALGKTSSVTKMASSSRYAFMSNPFLDLNSKTDAIVNVLRSAGCPETMCPVLSKIKNGAMSCEYIKGVGQVCRYKCNTGLRLVGSQVTRCLVNNKESSKNWTDPPPTCKVKVTQCPSITLDNGLYTCSDTTQIGSVCVFQCNSGYFLLGIDTLKCEDIKSEAVWSAKFPTCEPDMYCLPPLIEPVNGLVDCPDGNKFNAECSVTCDDGYYPIGSTQIKCNQAQSGKDAKWDKVPPTCEECNANPCEADIMFVVDGSKTLHPDEYEVVQNWLLSIVNVFIGSLELDIIDLGVLQYGGVADIQCGTYNFQKKVVMSVGLPLQNISFISDSIKNMQQVGGCPAATHATKRAAEFMLSLGRKDVRKILVVVTTAVDVEEAENVEQCVSEAGVVLCC